MTINSLNFDAQELREKILDLAMRGKLVKQDPNDEPASVLLEKITKEKEQLIKEKKIKKTKPLPEITDEEKPFDIPDSWEWVRLGEIGEVISGGTPKTSVKEYWEDGNIPWITPAIMADQIENIKFNKDKIKYINDKGLNNSSAHLITKNSLVVSSRAPIGYINIVPFDYTTNQGCKSVTLFNKTSIKFVYFALKYRVPDMKKRASGTTFKEISGSKFNQTLIPLPPLEEQSRIADKVAQLFALLRKVESSTDQYVELQQFLKNKVLDLAMQGKLVEQRDDEEPASVLLEKIRAEKAELIKEKKIKKTKPLPEITDKEKPFDIPGSWKWVRLGEVSNIFAGGDKPSDYSAIKDEQHPFEIFSNGVANAGLYGFTKQARVYEKSLTISARGTIGHVEIRRKPFLPIIRLITVTPYISDTVNFLGYYLTRFAVKSEGSSIPQLTVPKLKPKIIPLPSLNEQKRIVTKIEELLDILD